MVILALPFEGLGSRFFCFIIVVLSVLGFKVYVLGLSFVFNPSGFRFVFNPLGFRRFRAGFAFGSIV